MIEAEADSEDRGAYVFDAEDDEDCYDDGYLGMVVKLKEVISAFPVGGDLRELRNWHLQLGDLQNDDCGVDDLEGAKDAYTQAKRLSMLIAKGKTITTSTAANTIDKSVQSVLLVEGASSDTGITEDRGHYEWSPIDDELLAVGKVQFPSGCAHRWRDIAQLVGKNAEACRSRVRSEAFIKVHLYPGEKKEDKLEGDVRTATTPPVLDDSRERVVESEGLEVGAEDRGSVYPHGDFSTTDIAELFDLLGLRNYAALARWLLDRNDLSGLRTVASVGLDEDAEDNAAGLFKLGTILHEEGNLLAAERAFRMAITGQPTDPDPYLWLGEMLEASGNLLGAETVYRRANAAAPTFAEAFKNYIGSELYERHPSLRHNPEHPSRSGEGATHRPR